MSKPTTSRMVNAALKREGLPLTFEGTREGYHYFVFDDGANRFETHSVYTCWVRDLTVDQWLGHARDFMAFLAKQDA